MGLSGFGAGFDEVKTEPVVESGMAVARRAEDVGGEPAVACSSFHQIGSSGLWNSAGENVEAISAICRSSSSPDSGTDVDAGKKNRPRPDRWAARTYPTGRRKARGP